MISESPCPGGSQPSTPAEQQAEAGDPGAAAGVGQPHQQQGRAPR